MPARSSRVTEVSRLPVEVVDAGIGGELEWLVGRYAVADAVFGAVVPAVLGTARQSDGGNGTANFPLTANFSSGVADRMIAPRSPTGMTVWKESGVEVQLAAPEM